MHPALDDFTDAREWVTAWQTVIDDHTDHHATDRVALIKIWADQWLQALDRDDGLWFASTEEEYDSMRALADCLVVASPDAHICGGASRLAATFLTTEFTSNDGEYGAAVDLAQSIFAMPDPRAVEALTIGRPGSKKKPQSPPSSTKASP